MCATRWSWTPLLLSSGQMSSLSLSKEWLGVPTAQTLLSEIVRGLQLGLSHCILFQNGFEVQDVQDQLNDHLWNAGVFVRTLDLEQCTELSPVHALADAYLTGLRVEHITTESLIAHSDTPEVTLLGNFEALPRPKRQAWADFLLEWAEVGRRREVEKSICLLSQSGAWEHIERPPSALRLQLRFWHSVPTLLEAQGVYRHANRDVNAQALWRESMVTSLAAGDFCLGEWIWGAVDTQRSAIVSSLLTYAEYKGWAPKILADSLWSDWHPAAPGTVPVRPEDAGPSLWSRGWTVYTPEYGEEMHSALVALKGDETELTYRMWRAQVPLALPMIESIRLNVCRYLTLQHGVDWARLGGEESTGAYEELGRLEAVLRKSTRLYWEQEQWLEAVTLARYLRNELAHYSPVNFTSFARLWQYGAKIHQLKYSATNGGR